MALTFEFAMARQGITVPYPALVDAIRHNRGFVDLRGRPDLAEKIDECCQSPALRSLLVELTRSQSKIFTLGCDLGAHQEPDAIQAPRYVSGGYVQIMHVAYALLTPDEYKVLSETIADSFRDEGVDADWLIHFSLTFVQFNLDNFCNLTPSVEIWFYATSDTEAGAHLSRESLVIELSEALLSGAVQSCLSELPEHAVQ